MLLNRATDTVYIYTDASFSKDHGIAIIGSVLFLSTEEHDKFLLSELSESKISILEIKETNNIRAELRSAIHALQACSKANRVLLYCDCQTICDLPRRRKKLEQTSYISQSKNRPLVNEDLYREFYLIYDHIKPEINWIKGHSSGQNLDKIQKNFSHLDRAVRRNLRKAIGSK